MDNFKPQSKENRRKQIAGNMGLGVALGIIFGTMLGNIALGLTLGIVLGGIGSVWQTSEAGMDQVENDDDGNH